MSVSEFIFIKQYTSPIKTGERLASALQMELAHNEQGVFLSAAGVGNIPGELRGELYTNIYSNTDDPEGYAIFDNHQLVWEIWRLHSDEETQLAAARIIFLEIVHNLRWPVILVHNLGTLVASWDSERQLREYPPLTSPDDVDIATWE